MVGRCMSLHVPSGRDHQPRPAAMEPASSTTRRPSPCCEDKAKIASSISSPTGPMEIGFRDGIVVEGRYVVSPPHRTRRWSSRGPARAAVVGDSFYRRAWAPRILGSGPPAVSLSPTSSRIVSSSDDELRGVRRGELRREACDEARVRLGAQDWHRFEMRARARTKRCQPSEHSSYPQSCRQCETSFCGGRRAAGCGRCSGVARAGPAPQPGLPPGSRPEAASAGRPSPHPPSPFSATSTTAFCADLRDSGPGRRRPALRNENRRGYLKASLHG